MRWRRVLLTLMVVVGVLNQTRVVVRSLERQHYKAFAGWAMVAGAPTVMKPMTVLLLVVLMARDLAAGGSWPSGGRGRR